MVGEIRSEEYCDDPNYLSALFPVLQLLFGRNSNTYNAALFETAQSRVNKNVLSKESLIIVSQLLRLLTRFDGAFNKGHYVGSQNLTTFARFASKTVKKETGGELSAKDFHHEFPGVKVVSAEAVMTVDGDTKALFASDGCLENKVLVHTTINCRTELKGDSPPVVHRFIPAAKNVQEKALTILFGGSTKICLDIMKKRKDIEAFAELAKKKDLEPLSKEILNFEDHFIELQHMIEPKIKSAMESLCDEKITPATRVAEINEVLRAGRNSAASATQQSARGGCHMYEVVLKQVLALCTQGKYFVVEDNKVKRVMVSQETLEEEYGVDFDGYFEQLGEERDPEKKYGRPVSFYGVGDAPNFLSWELTDTIMLRDPLLNANDNIFNVKPFKADEDKTFTIKGNCIHWENPDRADFVCSDAVPPAGMAKDYWSRLGVDYSKDKKSNNPVDGMSLLAALDYLSDQHFSAFAQKVSVPPSVLLKPTTCHHYNVYEKILRDNDMWAIIGGRGTNYEILLVCVRREKVTKSSKSYIARFFKTLQNTFLKFNLKRLYSELTFVDSSFLLKEGNDSLFSGERNLVLRYDTAQEKYVIKREKAERVSQVTLVSQDDGNADYNDPAVESDSDEDDDGPVKDSDEEPAVADDE